MVVPVIYSRFRCWGVKSENTKDDEKRNGKKEAISEIQAGKKGQKNILEYSRTIFCFSKSTANGSEKKKRCEL